MTLTEAKKKIEEAAALIFQVEEALSKSSNDGIRREGYRCRISLGSFENTIRQHCDENDISNHS